MVIMIGRPTIVTMLSRHDNLNMNTHTPTTGDTKRRK